jgi:hypothetical protein
MLAALTKGHDLNLPLAPIPERLRPLRPRQLPAPVSAVYETASGAGLAHGRLAVDPMRSGEVLASMSGLVGEEDVGGAAAQLSGTAADVFSSPEGNGPN